MNVLEWERSHFNNEDLQSIAKLRTKCHFNVDRIGVVYRDVCIMEVSEYSAWHEEYRKGDFAGVLVDFFVLKDDMDAQKLYASSDRINGYCMAEAGFFENPKFIWGVKIASWYLAMRGETSILKKKMNGNS